MRVLSLFFALSSPFMAWAQSLPAYDALLCGDGLMQTGEACDDGNATSGDGCRRDCLKIEACGDGVMDIGEACDDGNTASQDGCSYSCFPDSKASFCGDGLLDAFQGEVCDDGNNLNSDGCSADCLRSGVCGDSVLEGNEVCDDGNTQDGDSCSADCRVQDLSFGPKRPGLAGVLSTFSTITGLTFFADPAFWALGFEYLKPETRLKPRLVPGLDFEIKRRPYAYVLFSVTSSIIGPSMGHFYAGEWKHALLFTGLRGAAMGAIVGGSYLDGHSSSFSKPAAARALGAISLLAGMGSFATLAIYDLIDAPFSARRTNRKFLNDKLRLSLSPAPLSTSSGLVPGLVLGGSF